MRNTATALTLLAALGVAACANNPNRPTDVGNMQTPAPRSTGVYGTERPGVDVGSMSQPAPTGGVVVRESRTPDTGNMQLPAAAQGNSAPRSY